MCVYVCVCVCVRFSACIYTEPHALCLYCCPGLISVSHCHRRVSQLSTGLLVCSLFPCTLTSPLTVDDKVTAVMLRPCVHYLSQIISVSGGTDADTDPSQSFTILPDFTRVRKE